MLYPIQPLSARNTSSKKGCYDLKNQLLEKRNTSAQSPCKLPSLSNEKGKESLKKMISGVELFKSIMKRSVSLDLSEEARRNKQQSKPKESKEILDRVRSQTNRFEHYKKCIESISYEKMESLNKISPLGQLKTLEPRKSQIPYIRAQKKQFHPKNIPNRYDNIVCDEAFVRINSPGRIRVKVETSKVFQRQSKIFSTVQQQLGYNSPYKQQPPIRKLSHPPIKAKKNKILLAIAKGEETQTDLYFTPWQYNPETQIYSEGQL